MSLVVEDEDGKLSNVLMRNVSVSSGARVFTDVKVCVPTLVLIVLIRVPHQCAPCVKVPPVLSTPTCTLARCAFVNFHFLPPPARGYNPDHSQRFTAWEARVRQPRVFTVSNPGSDPG